jgi:regulator of protease activity HflC (stomatin/prohibitin superfamily)
LSLVDLEEAIRSGKFLRLIIPGRIFLWPNLYFLDRIREGVKDILMGNKFKEVPN